MDLQLNITKFSKTLDEVKGRLDKVEGALYG